MEGRHLLKSLKDDGWYLGDTEGACRQYVHGDRPGVVTVWVGHTHELGPQAADAARSRAAGAAPPVDPDAEAAPVLEATRTGFSAHADGFPGCVATGETEAEARERFEAALSLHRNGLRAR